MKSYPLFACLALAVAAASACAMDAQPVAARMSDASPQAAAPAMAAAPASLSSQVPGWMRKAHVPGIAIAKIEHGRVAWTATFGERAPDTPMTPGTVFNVASLTKPVFALMTLHLVADGKIGLDTPLAGDWVDPDIADDPRRNALTPRLALSHQTGFQNWRGADKLAFSFAPGSRHEYSGEGYEYLRRALEHRTGKSLPTLMAATVLDRVDMQHTSFGWSKAVHGPVATGFESSGTPYDMDYLHDRKPSAAASMLTTIGDYGRFAAWVAGGADLPEALFDDMRRPQLAGETAEHFGLGWRLIRMGGQTVLSHDGRENGVRTQVYVLPATGEGLVIFTNSDNGELMTRPLTNAMLDDGKQLVAAVDGDIWTYLQRMPRAQLPRIAQVVVSSPSFMSKWLHAVDVALVQASSLTDRDKRKAQAAIEPFVQSMLDGNASPDQAKALVELAVASDAQGPRWRDRFTPAQAGQWVAALSARSGSHGKSVPDAVVGASATQDNDPAAVVPDARLAAYVGEYRLPSNQLLISIRKTGSGLEAAAEGMPVVKLYPLSQTLFMFKEDKTRFEFVTGDAGKPTGLRVIWSASRSEVADRVD